MSDEEPRSGRQRFVEALRVRQNAIRGFSFGFVVTAIVYVLFIVVFSGEFSLARGAYYVALGVTMTLGLGGLATAVLVAFRVRQLTREL